MNHCRICHKIIPNTFNGGPALRCSSCRAKQDHKLSEMLFDLGNENYLETQNENLRNKVFDSENECAKLNYKLHKIKDRYDVLWERHSVVLNENTKLNAENERLRKGIERLFARIHVLEGRNAEGLKDYKQLKSEILFDEQ